MSALWITGTVLEIHQVPSLSVDDMAFVVRRCVACDVILLPHTLSTGVVVDECPNCHLVAI